MNRGLPIFLVLKIVALVLVQVFIFSKLALFHTITPMIYVIFLFIYPTHKNRSLALSTAFFMGLALDILLDQLAIHTISLLIVTYLRPKIMRFNFGLNFEQKSFKIYKAPLQQRLLFLLLITGLHHLIFFSTETFSFFHLGLVLKKTFATTPISFFLSALIIVLFSPKKT